ncbi:MAG: AbrB/MazE/SpoVT family DNA-binding domain-containing protein [Deltaproteobacteria bacterium]|nr:AbrB/MazE/SpoVT family DNA-binding domain-containing protein [Deltaproteobacteria bacterium]
MIKSKSLIRSKEELLGTNLIEFKVIEGKVVIEPVRDVGGILKKYVKKSLPFEKERELAWEKVADEKKCV